MTMFGSNEGSNTVRNPNPGAGSEELKNRRKRRHGNSGSFRSKPRPEPEVKTETPEDEREPDTGPEEPLPSLQDEEAGTRISKGSGGRQLIGKATERRGPTRPPNYRLHVVAALSVTIIITFLAGGKDIISSVKGK
jgi:hypothetical protein